MKLHEFIESQPDNTMFSIRAASSYFFIGTKNELELEKEKININIVDFLNRDVIDFGERILSSGGSGDDIRVIITGNESGNYWTRKEYLAKNKKICVIAYNN